MLIIILGDLPRRSSKGQQYMGKDFMYYINILCRMGKVYQLISRADNNGFYIRNACIMAQSCDD